MLTSILSGFSMTKVLKAIIGPVFFGLVIVILVLLLKHQADLLDKSQERIGDLETEIREIEQADVLTEELRQDNAKLSKQLADLTLEIQHAKSGADPLPSDIRNIVRGVLDSAPERGGQ